MLLKLTALALMVMVGTGVYLWWPKAGRWKAALSVRRSSRQYICDLNCHRLAGVAALPFLFMWALTGLNFSEPFQPAIQKVWYALTFAGAAPPLREHQIHGADGTISPDGRSDLDHRRARHA